MRLDWRAARLDVVARLPPVETGKGPSRHSPGPQFVATWRWLGKGFAGQGLGGVGLEAVGYITRTWCVSCGFAAGQASIG
jgi:hypothetical protein